MSIRKGNTIISGNSSKSNYNELTNKPSINNTVLSGNKTTSDLNISYDDLNNKPTIPTKTSQLTNDSGFVTHNGVWYATCSTTNSTQTKVATTVTGDFKLETGAQAVILMSKNNTYAGKAKLNIDNTGAKDLVPYVGASLTRYFWKSNEAISVVYDGTQYVMIDSHTADTTCYGITKLSTAIDSTATDLAATPSAVKSAYDLAAGKQDALVSGTNIKTINNQSILGAGNITALTSVPNASQTQVGGIKTRFDSSTGTLYITNDGSDA